MIDTSHINNKEILSMRGVKTPEGKEISKYNACKHNILRQTITEYEEGLYERFLHRVVNELKPTDVVEEILVERIAICYLKLFRIGKAEKELLLERLRPAQTKNILVKKADNSWEIPLIGVDEYKEIVIRPAYYSQIKTEDIEKILDIYSRYEITIENRLYKALHELERIRRMKSGENIPTPMNVHFDITKESSFGKNTNEGTNL